MNTPKPIHALRIADRPAWVKRVREALASAGTLAGAAKLLDISSRTLEDWIYGNGRAMAASPELTKGLTLPPSGYHGHAAVVAAERALPAKTKATR